MDGWTDGRMDGWVDGVYLHYWNGAHIAFLVELRLTLTEFSLGHDSIDQAHNARQIEGYHVGACTTQSRDNDRYSARRVDGTDRFILTIISVLSRPPKWFMLGAMKF